MSATCSYVFKNITKGQPFRFPSGDTTTVFVKRTLKTYAPQSDPTDIRRIDNTYFQVVPEQVTQGDT